MSKITEKTLRQKVIQALKTVYDPELPIDVYELGLIYKIEVNATTKKVYILMTLTTPNCPAAELIPMQVKKAVQQLMEVRETKVELTFEPPYTPDRLSEEAKLILT